MSLKAPKGAVETVSGSGENYVFPAGNYEAVLEEVRVRDIPTNEMGEPFSGWATDDGSVLGLQFGQIEPIDVDTDPGDRKFFVDITLRDGELLIGDVDITERGVPYWQLQRSARTLLNFFLATGHVHENGNGEVEVADEAIAELEAGKMNGLRIGLGIINRKESTKRFKQRKMEDPSAERRVYDGVGTFFAV